MLRVQRSKVTAISTRWIRRVAAPYVCFVPWAALASCRPLPQQLLPVSAAGGGRRRCKQGAARPFQPQRGWLHTKKLAASLNDFFSFLRFEVAARRNVRATACFHADANAPAGSQRQHMPFPVTTPSREKVTPKRPQSFRSYKFKNNISADIAKANASAILNRPAVERTPQCKTKHIVINRR